MSRREPTDDELRAEIRRLQARLARLERPRPAAVTRRAALVSWVSPVLVAVPMLAPAPDAATARGEGQASPTDADETTAVAPTAAAPPTPVVPTTFLPTPVVPTTLARVP